jgi:alpha-1,2-mannosyltransferase
MQGCRMAILRMFLRGDWLHRARILAFARMLLALHIVGLAVLVLGTHGAIVPLEKPTTTDFVSFHAAGSLAIQGHPELAYDQAAHFAREQETTAPGIGYQYFFYPPVFLLLCAPLSLLPYLMSFVLFQTLTLGFFLAVLRAIMGHAGRGWLVAALAFPPVFWTLGLGQNSFLTAALMGLGMLLLPTRPFLAGLALGALCYKPHFGILLPLVLLAGRQWWAIAGAALAAAGLTLVSVLVFGLGTWQAYLAAIQTSRAVYESGAIDFIGMATPFGGALLLGLSPAQAHGVQILALALTAVAVIRIWWGATSLEVRAASVAAGTLLAVHLALVYDVLLLLLAMAWLVRAGISDGFRAGEKTVFFGVYLALLVMTKFLVLRGVDPAPPIPLGPLAAAAILILCVRRARSGLVGAPRPLL